MDAALLDERIAVRTAIRPNRRQRGGDWHHQVASAAKVHLIVAEFYHTHDK